MTRFSGSLRALPLGAGALGFIALLLNRSASGAAPVVDAGSAQSRVDVLVIALAATLALTGFQWLALAPVEKETVRAPFTIGSFHKRIPFHDELYRPHTVTAAIQTHNTLPSA